MKIQFYKKCWSDYWITLEEYVIPNCYWIIIIPEWFITDFWSIPKVFWWIAHPLEYPYYEAFIMHDYLYSCLSWCNRKDCDIMLFKKVEETSFIRALLFYIAVRIFWKHNFKRELPFKKE